MDARTARLSESLDGLRTAFDADGITLQVEPVGEHQVTLRLLIPDDACAECLVPDEMIGEMALTALRDVSPEVSDVRVERQVGTAS